MGSGKSSIGAALAKQLDFLHLDTDICISKLEGTTINEIFESRGEAYFRDKENSLFKFINEIDKVVISTGGGFPIHNELMKQILASGLTIYLDTKLEDIHVRLENNQNTRPLLNLSNEDRKDFIRNHLADRVPTYEQAHLSITTNLSVPEITQNLVTRILSSA